MPPCYCGLSDILAVQVQATSGDPCTFSARFNEDLSPDVTNNVIKVGDTIQFNDQGYSYTSNFAGTTSVTTGGTNSGTLTVSLMTVKLTEPAQVLTPWPASGWSDLLPYRVFRSPVKGGATPLQLPAASVIDLEASGYGSNYVGHQDLTVMFSPTGSVDSVYYGATRLTPSDPIYLLVGKRERVISQSNFVPNNTNEPTLANWQDLNNLWVAVNVQTGQITTEPMAYDGGAASADNSILAARGLAKQGQGMGGR